MHINTSLDQVTLVNEHDEVIGSMDKIEAHRGEARLHRAVSVYLFRRNNNTTPLRSPSFAGQATQQPNRLTAELLIQQRSAKKIVGAGQWANTVCGNVRPGESYQECAYRRLKEELGITKVQLQPIYTFEYHLQCNEEFSEWEIDQVFVGWYDGEVKPNPEEVQNFAWVNWEELREKEKTAKLLTKNFKTKEINLSIQQHNNITTQQLTLSPWFVWMLGDEKLIKIIQKQL